MGYLRINLGAEGGFALVDAVSINGNMSIFGNYCSRQAASPGHLRVIPGPDLGSKQNMRSLSPRGCASNFGRAPAYGIDPPPHNI